MRKQFSVHLGTVNLNVSDVVLKFECSIRSDLSIFGRKTFTFLYLLLMKRQRYFDLSWRAVNLQNLGQVLSCCFAIYSQTTFVTVLMVNSLYTRRSFKNKTIDK